MRYSTCSDLPIGGLAARPTAGIAGLRGNRVRRARQETGRCNRHRASTHRPAQDIHPQMNDSATTELSPFPCARFIKEIGRGPHGARALAPEDTQALYSAMLDGRVSELELGAVLLAYRLK